MSPQALAIVIKLARMALSAAAATHQTNDAVACWQALGEAEAMLVEMNTPPVESKAE
jgi:hypothetical protein